jgi:hypothetical protein
VVQLGKSPFDVSFDEYVDATSTRKVADSNSDDGFVGQILAMIQTLMLLLAVLLTKHAVNWMMEMTL